MPVEPLSSPVELGGSSSSLGKGEVLKRVLGPLRSRSRLWSRRSGPLDPRDIGGSDRQLATADPVAQPVGSRSGPLSAIAPELSSNKALARIMVFMVFGLSVPWERNDVGRIKLQAGFDHENVINWINAWNQPFRIAQPVNWFTNLSSWRAADGRSHGPAWRRNPRSPGIARWHPRHFPAGKSDIQHPSPIDR